MIGSGGGLTALTPGVISLCHTAEHLRPEVIEAVRLQGFEPDMVLTPSTSPYAYGSFLRRKWRSSGPMVIVEQRSIPPKGSLPRLVECPELWCLHPHDTGRRRYIGALACVKFSEELRIMYPDLADRALAARGDSIRWWRLGILTTPYNPATSPPRTIRNVTVAQWAARKLGRWPGPLWPTTTPGHCCDTPLMRELERVGVEPHVHEPETHHLGGSATEQLTDEQVAAVMADMRAA